MRASSEAPREFTLVVFTENGPGLLQRVVSVFTRRHVNIHSLTTSESSTPGIHRFTVVVTETPEMVDHLREQLNKQVDVLRAFSYELDEVVQQEVALYKVPTAAFAESDAVERIVRSHNARILSIEPEYVVVERTGYQRETQALLDALRPIGVYEFVRSGLIAIVKPMERLNTYLQALEAAKN